MTTAFITFFTLMFFAYQCIALGDGTPSEHIKHHPDSVQSVVTLRYNLTPGEHYSYKLVKDQVVVNNHSTRLQTTFAVEALARDAHGNTRCRITLTSNPVIDSSAIHGTQSRTNRFVGYRKWIQEQAYEAVLDALGQILASTVVQSSDTTTGPIELGHAEPLSERVTEYTNIPQEDPATPELMYFILPMTSKASSVTQGAEWCDTIMIGSKTQFTPAIRHGQTEAPIIAKDSLFRSTRVDSVLVLEGRQQCFMSVKTERHNASGKQFIAFSKLRRDVLTGLIIAINEKAYRLEHNDQMLHYTATAVLVQELSSALTPIDKDPILIPR